MPPRASWLQGFVRRRAPSCSSSGFLSLAALAPRAFPSWLPSLLLTPSSNPSFDLRPPSPHRGRVGVGGLEKPASARAPEIHQGGREGRQRGNGHGGRPK